jgi:hypothetical protein
MQEAAGTHAHRALNQPPGTLQIYIGWRAEEVAEAKATALRYRRIGGGVHHQVNPSHRLIETRACTQVAYYPLHTGAMLGSMPASTCERPNMMPCALELRNEIPPQMSSASGHKDRAHAILRSLQPA